jgi:fructose-1,6-bisphosphatase I / sedoheptulose-1,7-bisphosphatase
MHLGRTTLSKFLIQQLTGIPGASDLGALLIDVAAAVKAISAMTAKGALGGYLGEHGATNAQGETQQKLDVLAHEVMIRSCEWGGLVAGMVSEELEHPYPVPAEYARGRYLLVFDPLDGSSNTDVNVSVDTTRPRYRRSPPICSRASSRSRPATPSMALRPCSSSPWARARTASRSIGRSATSS